MPRSYYKTDIGMRRSMNQDYVFSKDTPLGELSCLYLVADGMGGHQAGELASRCTVDTIEGYVASTAGDAGAASIMPLGAPIGSNKGICTKEFEKSIHNVTKSLWKPNSVCKKYTDNI